MHGFIIMGGLLEKAMHLDLCVEASVASIEP
jgi:hypothetical protein